MFGKNKVAMLVAEFVGTFVLAVVALAMIERTTFPYFLGGAMGLTYAVFWYVFGRSSGAHFNPAITIGHWSLRKIGTTVAFAYIIVQVLGGLVAWLTVTWLQGSVLSNIAGKQFDAKILVAEAIGALILGMGVAAASYNSEDDLRSVVTVGGALFLGVCMAAFAGNAFINPAVAVGARSLSWSYVVGPLVGVFVGMNLYAWLFLTDQKVLFSTSQSSVSARSTSASKKAVKKPVRKSSASKKR